MTYRTSRACMAVLALSLPVTLFADLTGTQTLSSGAKFSFDTGTVVTSGGDIQFTGTTIAFVGNATGYGFGNGGTATYGTITSTLVSSGASFFPFSNTAISGSNLVANEVFLVKTNGGNYAKVLINTVSSSSLSFQYDTFGVSGGSSNGPNITAVLDAGSYTASIAEGSIFVVKGTNLSAAGYTAASFPLPASMGGVSISFTPAIGGSPTAAYIIYLYNENGVNQLAAVLPSTLAVGSYSVTVTNGSSTSQPFSVQVVKSKPGLITADSTGNGLVVAQNYISSSELDVDRFTTGTISGFTVSPSKPGQVVIAWATGLGPVPGGDNTASAGYNFEANGANVQVIVGGTSITPAYAGRAPGLAGTDQINFTLPSNIATGCTVPFQISVNGVTSQSTFIAIAPSASATACVQPGYTTSQLQGFDNGNVVYYGSFGLSQSTITEPGFGSFTTAGASGGFIEYTGFELAGIPATATSTTTGNCTVTQIPAPAGGGATGVGIGLDAGAITLTGPSGSGINNVALTETSDVYSVTFSTPGSPIPGGVSGTIVAGQYTLNGAGGQNVGKFSASLTIGPPLVITGGLPTTVNRSAGLTINWTGGNASDIVLVSGLATNPQGANNVQTGASFACYTTAGAGGINIPSSILNQLPAVTAASEALTQNPSVGGLDVFLTTSSGGSNGAFSAPLTAGGSTSAIFANGDSVIGQAAFQ